MRSLNWLEIDGFSLPTGWPVCCGRPKVADSTQRVHERGGSADRHFVTTRRRVMRYWAIIGILVLATPLFAGIVVSERTVNKLTIDGHDDGQSWAVSSPTLKSSRGYLAYDAEASSSKVTFRWGKVRGTSWSFIDLEKFKHTKRLGGRHDDDEETRGYTMKLQVSEGPNKGWYLGRKEGKLVLVEHRRDAATVKMVLKIEVIRHP
jgi:hypothetical protein